jgi:succinylarginine dihydrolase
MKTIDAYADEIQRYLTRHQTLGRADVEMTLIAVALSTEDTDAARVEAIRRIVAADNVVSDRMIDTLRSTG